MNADDVSAGVVSGVEIHEATPADLPAIETLLSAHELPLQGVEGNVPTTLVARDNGAVVGCAAVEFHGGHALLRSVAVARAYQGQGIGGRLAAAAIAGAADGSRDVFLLTETAAVFFVRLGFREVPRAGVPPAIRASSEYSVACSATATVMQLALPGGAEGVGGDGADRQSA